MNDGTRKLVPSNETLVQELFYLTAQQVKCQRRGHLRHAVWYKRAARVIGTAIMVRVENGTWINELNAVP